MLSTLPNIPGYCIQDEFSTSDRSRLFHAQRLIDKKAVIIKIMANKYPDFQSIQRFRQQYDLIATLNIAGIVKPIELLPWQNQLALVMPDTGAVDSITFLAAKPVSITCFLSLAEQLADTLDQLHQQHIIHKDIKPHNIIINKTATQVQLIDFSLSSRLLRESVMPIGTHVIDGTLDYISPEQTGRMNRGLDYRTDFYSLGVTFYQWLTGQLPFQSQDKLELLHAHLARQPRSLITINTQIPQILNDIVLKLMAKNAEDRYQSGKGLKYDLQQCRKQWHSNQHITPFTLAKADRFEKFFIPEKLYGRDKEVKQLIQQFNHVVKGNTALILVEGQAGIGKTALINELYKPVTRERGYFIKGKFDQLNRETPYLAFTQAITDLIHQILKESEPKRNLWKKKIIALLNNQGQVLTTIFPILEQLIGKQAAVTKLEGQAAVNRFHYMFQLFICLLANKEHPLILFLDDLQWIDLASLKLLLHILTEQPRQALLVLGAYRDQEVDTDHPLMMALTSLQDKKVNYQTLHLCHLTEQDLTQLLAQACYREEKVCRPLAKIIQNRVKGNPFFIHQFLYLLVNEALLTFNTKYYYWDFHLQAIQQLAASHNIETFMLEKLAELDTSTQTLISLAACIGNNFDLHQLANIAEKTVIYCIETLQPTITLNYIVPINMSIDVFQNPALASNSAALPCCFSHDRIQKAAYQLIPENKKASIHLNIGRLLQKHANSKLMDIVQHLNLGQASITTVEQKLALAQLNYDAAEQTKHANAWKTAWQYYSQGFQLLSHTPSELYTELKLNLSLGLIESSYLLNDFEQVHTLSKKVLTTLSDPFKQIIIHRFIILSFIAQKKIQKAITYGLQFLQHLGIYFPAHPNKKDVDTTLQSIQLKLAKKSLNVLLHLPVMTDKKALGIVSILTALTPALRINNHELYILSRFKILELTVIHGNSAEAIHSYAAYGYILSGEYNDIERGYPFFELSLQLLELLKAKEKKAIVQVAVYVALCYKKALKDSVQAMEETILVGREVGDMYFSGAAVFWCGLYSFYMGMELFALYKKLQQYDKYLTHNALHIPLEWHRIVCQLVANLLGKTTQSKRLNGEYYNEELSLQRYQDNNESISVFFLAIHQLILGYLFSDKEYAQQALSLLKIYINQSYGLYCAPLFYFYQSLFMLKYYTEQSLSEQQKIDILIENNKQKMAYYAKHAPMNFQHKWALIAAEYCRVKGERIDAMEYYDQAIQGAKVNKYIQEEALANELVALFYLQYQQYTNAEAYMHKAYYAYSHWGAKRKVDDLIQRYPELLTTIQAEKLVAVSHSGSGSDVAVNFDMDTLFKATQALSSELSLKQLLLNMLDLVMENTGARRCVLLLQDEEKWHIVGESNVDSNTHCLSHILLDNYQQLPQLLLKQVIDNRRSLIIDNAIYSTEYCIDDPYFKNTQVKSVLCHPICSQSRLLGLIYLENNILSNAFHHSRLQLLGLLATQAAISIENALLYENLEAKVTERTKALKMAQEELIDRSRQAGMAEIAQGIMHTIGNAITPLKITTQISLTLIQQSLLRKKIITIFDTIKNMIMPSEKVDKNRFSKIVQLVPESLENEYQQLETNLTDITKQINVIEEILHLQAKYTNAEDFTESLDINSVLKDSIQMIEDSVAKYQVKIITHFSSLPDYICVRYQIVQVFMHIIKNACEAMTETELARRTLTIVSESIEKESNTYIQIYFQDNGCGFEKATHETLFNYGFTTKNAANGTGLHLSGTYINRIGGILLAESDGKGKGAKFIIQLPY